MKKLFSILFVALCFSQTAFTQQHLNAAFFRAKVVPSGGGGGGGIVATDNFNRANGPIGSSWTDGITGTAAAIADQECQGALGASTYEIWNANSFANDQYSKVAVGADNAFSSARYVGVGVRLTGHDSTLCGYVFVSTGTSGDTELYRIDNGTPTSLKVFSGTAFDSLTAGDTITLKASGSSFTAWKNGIQIGAATTDSTYASGSAGMFQFGESDQDDWEGGNL